MAPAPPCSQVQNIMNTRPADPIGRADAMHPPGSKPWATMEVNQVVSIADNKKYPHIYTHTTLIEAYCRWTTLCCNTVIQPVNIITIHSICQASPDHADTDIKLATAISRTAPKLGDQIPFVRLPDVHSLYSALTNSWAASVSENLMALWYLITLRHMGNATERLDHLQTL